MIKLIKLKYLIICFSLLLILTGCTSNKKEIITLCKDNIEDYFIITESIDDYSVDTSRTIVGNTYRGYATLKISIRPKYNISVDNVIIKGEVKLSEVVWSDSYSPMVSFEMQLDKDGNGEYIKNLTASQSIIRPEKPSIYQINFIEISGTIEK
jgi:hypothetical protein